MKELKEKTNEELTTALAEKREEIRTVRFGIAGTKARDTHTVRKGRRAIARILTEMNLRARAS